MTTVLADFEKCSYGEKFVVTELNSFYFVLVTDHPQENLIGPYVLFFHSRVKFKAKKDSERISDT